MSGYSGTPLAKKLGIKSGYKVMVVNEPANYLNFFSDMPADVNRAADKEIDILHLFALSALEFTVLLSTLKNRIKKDGMIWVSWPKKASKIKTDLDENLIRETALALGMVDIKVCAIDEIWSGLKLVWRKENR